MQDFLHASHNEVFEAVERFERMISAEKVVYFDVHQVENIYEFYLDKNLLNQAEQIIEIGLKQHPQTTSLLVKKASLLADLGKKDEALGILKTIAPIEDTNPEVFMTIGWIMLQKSEIDQAFKYFNKAANLAFDDEENTLLEIAYNLSQAEAYEEAIIFLEKLIRKFPDNESALFELAFALDKTFDYKKSIDTYEKLLELNPFSENGWYNAGIVYNKLEQYLKANQAYDFTIAINPHHSEAYFNKGNSLVHHGCFSEALDAYLEHATLSNDVVLTYQYIADCWEQLGNFEMAIRFYQLVIKELPHNADAWYGIGTALMETKNFKGGLQAIDQAISINPLNADYWFAHARGLFELDKVEDASRSLENGLNIDPDEVTGWFELLKLKITLNAEFDIATYISTLVAQYDDVAAIYYLSAVAHYYFLKDTKTAVKELKTAIALNEFGLQCVEEDYPELLREKEVVDLLESNSQ